MSFCPFCDLFWPFLTFFGLSVLQLMRAERHPEVSEALIVEMIRGILVRHRFDPGPPPSSSTVASGDSVSRLEAD